MTNNEREIKESTKEEIMAWSKKVSESYILSARTYYLYKEVKEEQDIETEIEKLFNKTNSTRFVYSAKRLYDNLFIVTLYDNSTHTAIYTYHLEGIKNTTNIFYPTIEEAILTGMYAKFHNNKVIDNIGYITGKALDVIDRKES